MSKDTQAHIFRVHAWSLGMTLDDFEPDQWRFQPHGMSHALWILGHIVLDRKLLGNLLGLKEEITDRDRLFDIGTKPEDVPADLEGAEILEEFQAVHGRFLEHLDGMTAEDLATGIDVQFPESEKTRLGALQFLLMHESYHVGQLGALRVMAGKGSWISRMQPPEQRRGGEPQRVKMDRCRRRLNRAMAAKSRADTACPQLLG